MMQTSKDSRSATSCSECQRRKQKCSREWPCNHCQSRKVPHLCQFGPRKVQTDSSPDSSQNCRSLKRSNEEIDEESPPISDGTDKETENGLKAWGYMPGHVYYNLGRDDPEEFHSSTALAGSEESNEVNKVLYAIPPRTLTDAIVNHFLNHVNVRYNSIYAPTFTNQYVQWWSDRINNKELSPVFTCLLLRVCAYSAQYFTPELCKTIEFELACNIQTLTQRFYRAAEQLSSSFTASNTSIERVQGLFLRSAWLKSDSQIVESWHNLGCCIREAQELGLDSEAANVGLSEFDVEIRRRLWCLLYIWDWQMSSWLARPHLIDQRNTSFVFPNLRLDEPSTQPNMLSPFAHISLQAQLGRRMVTKMGDVLRVADLSPEQVLNVLAECDTFINELPPIFRMENTDTSLDQEHPFYIFQRHQLHVVSLLSMLDILKPYLARSPEDRTSLYDVQLRDKGIEIGLKVLEAARKLFDHEFPINSKFHLVVFCVFDTGAILCSAIIHDTSEGSPYRDEVMDAIEGALAMLHQLSVVSKIGASSYKFLSKLVQAAPRLAQQGRAQKRQKTTNGEPPAPTPAVPAMPPPDTDREDAAPPAMDSFVNSIPDISTTDDISFDLDEFLRQDPFGNSARLDIGGMEEIWDWENLNLDIYFDQGNTGSLDPATTFMNGKESDRF
ncbi:fungal-specific transcription factor domain-domain-containing protein [Clohesyomyces aquaticus]|uniref:Fungal-specific transcription factor domain-domain-containing protein n=1 Tax=Clohesyomyces aquaticus TaxID=1231657 RepID=A0A1Y1ZLM7_9PLEO|nr:fungal-specific transcription factor domain-domain-containing protein [Clohesyomyces aquaticus]